MDWMYKEQQDTIEESSHAMNNQPSTGDSSTNFKGKSSTETNETEDKVGSADEDKMSVQSTHLEHKEAPAEDFSSLVGTVVSDTATATDSEQTAKEDIDQLVQSSSDTMSSDKAGFNEANSMNSGVLDGILERAAEEESKDTCDKDNTTIDLLKKEIDSLKAKIAELESYNQDKNELLATEPKQPISEKLEPMLDDEPKSYTPHIKLYPLY